ncbi:mandelate racemase/muconate lactonizing enzyme family protein [Conexibacter sp. JD483]|uniref:mandelate racemase/muconate lactonizing enzyme family protein n=1 Tax=unclassified Conexibacter TaxID=2627773 RepID=UPI00271E16C2|nr:MULTISPECIES: mandelate racemase/muconate lactonizing enzyme family protein [unclassified Conexibacter]MDO8187057.1 mandelate racemase/muconate lactonizing enzyme family protein [Conexibacter sp. CPCC 205706]MDO8200915.1 mandelate racemase/muconate lactonizing enzyme family protein [Conexibacter sp. CPCC 205762]MDR9372970.1 mandelate racemase/muconate lactonizing enzyme family protein [Conexibacter sp. JD483]
MSSSPAPAGVELTPRLTISHVETIPIRVPLGRVYRGSHYQMTHRSTIVTRVHTEEGIVGEAYAGDEDAGLLEIDAIIHQEIVPALVGQDAFAVERCWELARPATFDILRDRRLGLVACACIDAAIWDAIGKALEQPLWRLWGGYRDTIPMISIGGYYDSPLTVTQQVQELRERGLAGMKFKVGGRTPEEDAKRFKEARAAAGADFVLAADANQGYSVRDAIRFAKLVADDDLLWFEEPCQWHNDRRAMRDVRMVAGVPVCAGQSEFSAGGCRDLMVEGAIDVCNFDASWSGGPTEWRRVAGMARAFDVQMGHHEEPQCSSHLLASIPHGGYAECFDPDRDPIWWNLIANRPPLVDGAIALPTGPGFGWELDWEYVDRYRLPKP